MALKGISKDRILLPRWRSFNRTLLNKELNYSAIGEMPKSSESLDDNFLLNWERKKDLSSAVMLVNASIIVGDVSLATEAARFILNNKDKVTMTIAHVATRIISGKWVVARDDDFDNIEAFDNLQRIIGERIRKMRLATRTFNRNPFSWVQLARLFVIQGKIKSADRCMKVALQLAPTNRYVLRALVTFMNIRDNFHPNPTDKIWSREAYKILIRSADMENDPLLISTELGLSDYLRRRPRSITRGIKLLSDKKFTPRMTCELAAVLGTEELANGKNISALKYFKESLIDPNENSLAQAEWAKKSLDLDIDFTRDAIYEAKAKHFYGQGDFETAYCETKKWFLDQPFSHEPAILGSYISGSLLDDNDEAINFCNKGLISNPFDFTLLNNKAYFLAVKGDCDGAQRVFWQINLKNLDDHELIVAKATLGLITHKLGFVSEGNNLYDSAIRDALNAKKFKLATTVRLFKLRTKTLNFNTIFDFKAEVAALESEIEKFDDAELNVILRNIKNRINQSQRILI